LKKESTNSVEEQVNVASSKGDAEIVFVSNEADNPPNNNSCNSSVNEMNEESMILYYWLADSTTMLHVTNRHDIFDTYELLTKIVSGVGNIKIQAQGKGTIRIKTVVNNKVYNITLTDVLYIPNNQQNLLSLGRWDKAGYESHLWDRSFIPVRKCRVL